MNSISTVVISVPFAAIPMWRGGYMGLSSRNDAEPDCDGERARGKSSDWKSRAKTPMFACIWWLFVLCKFAGPCSPLQLPPATYLMKPNEIFSFLRCDATPCRTSKNGLIIPWLGVQIPPGPPQFHSDLTHYAVRRSCGRSLPSRYSGLAFESRESMNLKLIAPRS